MWWECSECGALVQASRAPEVCRECGTDSLFEPTELDPVAGDPEADSLHAGWLHAGRRKGESGLERR
jgi:hypothetical protein